jgi:hypothetical protein
MEPEDGTGRHKFERGPPKYDLIWFSIFRWEYFVLIRVRLKCEKFTNDRWTQSDDVYRRVENYTPAHSACNFCVKNNTSTQY